MSNILSQSHSGNKKLGKKISVYSRAVDDSCPNNCEFLDNACYAEKIEKRFPLARKAGLKNIKIQDWQKIRAFLIEANKKGNDVRLHERGDFGKLSKDGKKILDKNYINNFIKAYNSIQNPPRVYFYTHFYKKELANLSKIGISCFASVGNIGDYNKAKLVGFTKFAWSTSLRKGKDKNKKWETESGQIIPVCWEQLGIGKNKSTCADCGYCINPDLGSIAFMNH